MAWMAIYSNPLNIITDYQTQFENGPLIFRAERKMLWFVLLTNCQFPPQKAILKIESQTTICCAGPPCFLPPTTLGFLVNEAVFCPTSSRVVSETVHLLEVQF